MSLDNLKGPLCVLIFVVCCALVISIMTTPKATTPIQTTPIQSTRDGLTPQTAVIGTGTSLGIAAETKRQRVPTEIVWMPTLSANERCYLSVTLDMPHFAAAFVTVPEDWCKGMR